MSFLIESLSWPTVMLAGMVVVFSSVMLRPSMASFSELDSELTSMPLISARAFWAGSVWISDVTPMRGS